MYSKIFIGSDHGGFELKRQLIIALEEQNLEVVDCGAYHLDPEDDYPQFAFAVAEGVVTAETAGEAAIGILICRSGGGMAIAANKVPGARAIVATTGYEAEHARSNNNANIITFSADWITFSHALELVRIFLNTPTPDAPRHLRRLKQIASYEQQRHA